jgi:integrase/recombinase XerD
MTVSMQHLVQEYLDERRELGFALTVPGGQLLAFARFADASGHRGPLTRQLITSWARDEAKRATPLTWARRLDVIRPFAKHRARIEPGTYVPEADTFGRNRRRLAPHIYTNREIADLLAAAGRLSPKGTLRPATYRALFGLIAATGLRLSEALRLQCADVDLDAGMLTVRQTKFAKSRLVPLHPTTVRALKQYLALRQRHLPTVQDAPFLASTRGTALAKRTVHGVFDQLRKQLAWTARGGHAAPRIHDLRHTFICRRVQLWHEHGTEIDNAMVALSTYVGHAKVSDTYWYLTAAPDLMSAAGRRFEQLVEAGDA